MRRSVRTLLKSTNRYEVDRHVWSYRQVDHSETKINKQLRFCVARMIRGVNIRSICDLGSAVRSIRV